MWDYTYDLDGNLTEKSSASGSWVYAYDHERHLIQAKQYDDMDVLIMQADYKYDVFGNRIEKDVDLDGDGVGTLEVQKFAIDGWNPAKPTPIGNENNDVWADLDGSGSLITHYLRGDIVDQIIARTDGTDSRWYLADHLGTVRDVIDESGVLKDSIRYDGFGNIIAETDDAERGRYAWTGRQYDVETDLQYNRARYYDPTTGRWISQDPLGFDAGDSNLWRYVRNNATGFFDPAGLQTTQPRVEIGLRPFYDPRWFSDFLRDNGVVTPPEQNKQFIGGATGAKISVDIERLFGQSGKSTLGEFFGPNAAKKEFGSLALINQIRAANGGQVPQFKASLTSGAQAVFSANINDPNEVGKYHWYQEVRAASKTNGSDQGAAKLAKELTFDWKDDDGKRYIGQKSAGNVLSMLDRPGINFTTLYPKDAFSSDREKIVVSPVSAEFYRGLVNESREKFGAAAFQATFEFKTHLMYTDSNRPSGSRKGVRTLFIESKKGPDTFSTGEIIV